MDDLRSTSWAPFIEVLVGTFLEFIPEEKIPEATDRFMERFSVLAEEMAEFRESKRTTSAKATLETHLPNQEDQP